MAWLQSTSNPRRLTLPARCLVGRATSCTLRLTDDRRVSGEHATIAWTGERWVLRDLGSRNGTFVNGERVATGLAVALETHDQIDFGGNRSRFTFADAGPPVATARRLDDGSSRLAEDGLLFIPSGDDPRVCVFEDPKGGWRAEIDEQLRSVADGEVLTVDEIGWMLHLPVALEQTHDAAAKPLRLDTVQLRFGVSRDEEDVELSAVEGERRIELRPRHYQQLLLLLARARLEDAALSDVPEAEHGWRYVEDVCRLLRIEAMRLNTEIYRARKELAAANIQGAARVVERRRASRSLRLGTGSVVIGGTG